MSILDIPNDPIIQCTLEVGYPPDVLDKAVDISEQVMEEFEHSLVEEINSVDPLDIWELKEFVIALNPDFYDYLAVNGQIKYSVDDGITFHGVEVKIVDYLRNDVMYEWLLKEVDYDSY